jgi:ribosomal protein L19
LVKHFVTAQHDRSTKGAFKRVVQSVGVATICEDVGIERFIQLFGDVVQETSTVKSEAVSRSLRRYRAELYKLADTVSALWKPVEVVELIQELRTALLVA